MAERYIKQGGIEAACREALDEAAASAGRDVVKERVAAVRGHFDAWMKAVAEHPSPEIVVGRIDQSPASDDSLLNFASSLWEQAGVIDGLSVMGQVETAAREHTVVRVMHDGANLYLGFECFSDDAVIAPLAQGMHEQFPRGDRIEIFIDGDQRENGLYYHLAFNTADVAYDGVGYDKAWNGQWSVTTRVDADGWCAVAVIPWATLGVDPAEVDSGPSALFYRLQADRPDKPSQHSSWGGGAVHSAAGFGRLLLHYPQAQR